MAGALACLLGVVVLLGWALDVPALESVLAGWPKMPAATALSFTLAGAALLLLVDVAGAPEDKRWLMRHRAAQTCAGLVALIGLIALGEHLMGWHLGFDQLRFHELPSATGSATPGRMAPATALNFLLLGCALLLANHSRGGGLFQFLIFLAALIGWLGFSRYFYGGEPLEPYAQIAIHTALGFLILSAGVLCLRTDVGLMALLVSQGPSGVIARRLLPAAVLLPLGLGWLRLQAQRAGWFGTQAELSLFTLLNVIIFGVLIWANGAFLNRIERERTRAERATRESQQLLQAVTDNAAAIIWVKDLDGRYLLVNGGYENLVHLPREDIVGKTDYQLYPKEQAERYRAVDREALDRLTAVQAEEVAFQGNRPATYLSVKFPLLDETGKPYALCGISTDITQRKLADQALAAERALLRTLIDALPDVVFTKDTAGRFTMCNLAELDNVGLAREEELIGKTVFDLYPRELAESYHADDLRALSGQPVLNREEPSRNAAGEQRWYLTLKLPLRDHAGQVTGLVGMSRDITERKRAEENRNRAQKLEALGTLAGGIAHDFNNILLAIAGNTKLAMADLSVDHPVQQSLREIQQAGVRAIDLVRRILTFTREQEPNREPIQLQPVIEEAFKLLRPTLPARILINVDAPAQLPAVAADATQVHQILMNLATNAAHAIGRRNGLIELRLDAVQISVDMVPLMPDLRQGRYVRVSLSDDGCGMDKKTLERIFDPFFTTKPPGEGTGLGLSVVHGIMQSHDGAISVYSVPGQGTTFKLYFPAVEGEAEAVQPATRVLSPGAGERVLYVDDEKALVLLVTRVLQRLGYRVTGYSDPLEALCSFRSRPDEFDVVVTDLSMPGLTGFDLAQSLLETRPDVPIVITSGYLRAEDEQIASQLGIRALILKPNTVEELADVLDRLFSARRNSAATTPADL